MAKRKKRSKKKVYAFHRKSRKKTKRGNKMRGMNKYLMGAVAGYVAPMVLGNIGVDAKLLSAGAGYLAGGVNGAIAGVVAPMLLGNVLTGTSGSTTESNIPIFG